MTPDMAFAQFLEVASDLYRDNPEYRAELDAERRDEDPAPARRASTIDRLNELEWLIRNGMSPEMAVEAVGWELDTAQVAAIRWSHPVHARIVPECDPAPSAWWAREWSSARGRGAEPERDAA